MTNKRYTAIIMDDEPIPREALYNLIGKFVPDIDIIAMPETAKECISIINKQYPQILFLDVEMGDMSGFDLLKKLYHRNFQLIFTTGYGHYALEAFKVEAVDYLTKPIDIDLLERAAQKAIAAIDYERSKLTVEKDSAPVNVSIPNTRGAAIRKRNDLLYLEAAGSYTKFHCLSQAGESEMEVLLASKPLGEFDQLIENFPFFRVHRSFAVNLNQVTSYVKGRPGHVVMSNGAEINVAVRKSKGLQRMLKHISNVHR